MVTCAEMKALEKAADEAGLTYYQMMENAGTGAAEAIAAKWNVAGKNVLIICGKGNNGGDGYVVAGKLSRLDSHVSLISPEGMPTSPEAATNYNLCQEMNLPFIPQKEKILSAIKNADFIVDALYGTGFHGELKEGIRHLIEQINRTDARRITLDLPSGLSGDNDNQPVGLHVHGDMTVTFHDEKPIHRNPLARLGEVCVASIGIENLTTLKI